MKRTVLPNAKNAIMPFLLITALIISPNPGYALTSSNEVGESISGFIYKVVPVLIIGYIIVILLLRKIKSSGSNDTKPGGYINISELKKKGLLTPEEAKSIGESIRKQMERNQELEARRHMKFTGAEQMLLYDPEVLALQEKATAKSIDSDQKQEDLGSDKENPLYNSPTSAQLEKIQLPPDILNLWETGILSDQEIKDIRLRIWKKENS